MPTVVRLGDLRVKVYGPPREHPPAHVHVIKGREAVVIIRLGLHGAPPVIWEVYDMKPRDVMRSYRLVQEHAAALLAAWERIHG